MAFAHIDYEQRGAVAFIRFNDPARLNAMTADVCTDLAAALRQAEAETRAVVLGGHGRAFCSGANLASGLIDLNDPMRDGGQFVEAILNPLVLQIRNLTIPLVTAVRGAAVGAGASFALAGDLVVAGQSAYFSVAFCNIGLVPDGGSSHFLVQSLGRARASELMLLGERLTAEKAQSWGLVNRVVADDEVETAALELAAQLARGPKALGLIRQLAWAAADNDLASQLQLERDMQKHASRTKDFVEGVTSFLEKRAPSFKGE